MNSLKEFILKYFITTDNKNDRLHTQDIINILNENKFCFSNYKTAQIFKSMNVGEHKYFCIINKKRQAGYYYLKYIKDKSDLSKEQFIIKNFITTDNKKDKLHTMTIFNILTDNGYKISSIETGRLVNSIKIGKYNDKCCIDNTKKGGFEFIKYIGGEQ